LVLKYQQFNKGANGITWATLAYLGIAFGRIFLKSLFQKKVYKENYIVMSRFMSSLEQDLTIVMKVHEVHSPSFYESPPQIA
jgi:hypothetical protein